jgi:hypothetical protein
MPGRGLSQLAITALVCVEEDLADWTDFPALVSGYRLAGVNNLQPPPDRTQMPVRSRSFLKRPSILHRMIDAACEGNAKLL